ncbi:thermonuclease family protein [Patescibacteria group bacterium]|nr:thermonuclease family protein [Patescibacteria group bacterium]
MASNVRITKKNLLVVIMVVLILIWDTVFGKNLNSKIDWRQTSIANNQSAPNLSVKVTRVIDGDTIITEGNKKVRYIGINTAEIVYPTPKGKPYFECYAKEAYEENKKLVEGKTVTLIKDVSDVDKYGRLLRYVYVGDVFVNDFLVRQGFAKIMTVKPDTKYYQQFKIAQNEAKEKNLGLWKNCPND